MLDPGPIPRSRPPLRTRVPAARRRILRNPRGDFGLSIAMSSAPDVQWTGYRLRVLADRYLIEVWDEIANRDLIHAYEASITGEPARLLLRAYGLTSWNDIPSHCGGSWGSGAATVDIRATLLAIRLGLLLPPPPQLHLS